MAGHGNRRHIPTEQKWLFITMSAHLKPKEIAAVTEYSVDAVRRTLRIWRKTGDVVCRPLQAGRPRVLSPLDIAYLESLIERTPDIYGSELKSALSQSRGVEVDESTITRSLHRRGYTRKKIQRIAVERSEEARAEYQLIIGQLYSPETLVFLDESACNRHTARRTHGWAPIGDRARRHDYFVRGKRYSILPAISLDGVLHLDILRRSWTSLEFRAFVDVLLDSMNPYPQPNSVLVMDNAIQHHFDGLREMVEARGCRLQYLPAYSPDLNPIEEGFSAMKADLRRNRDYCLAEMSDEDPSCDVYALLYQSVFRAMTPENISGWFRDCSYVH